MAKQPPARTGPGAAACYGRALGSVFALGWFCHSNHTRSESFYWIFRDVNEKEDIETLSKQPSGKNVAFCQLAFGLLRVTACGERALSRSLNTYITLTL